MQFRRFLRTGEGMPFVRKTHTTLTPISAAWTENLALAAEIGVNVVWVFLANGIPGPGRVQDRAEELS